MANLDDYDVKKCKTCKEKLPDMFFDEGESSCRFCTKTSGKVDVFLADASVTLYKKWLDDSFRGKEYLPYSEFIKGYKGGN